MKTFEEYQRAANRTAHGDEDDGVGEIPLPLVNYALGLAGESGELVDIIKKDLFHGHTIGASDKVLSEAGDVLWYLAQVLRCYGFRLEDAATFNVAKLQKRYPDGFSPEASWGRDD